MSSRMGHIFQFAIIGTFIVVWLAGCGAASAQGATLRPERGNSAPQRNGIGRDERTSLMVDGLERTYMLHRPARSGTGQSLPLVLAFHGTGGQGPSMQGLSGLNAIADREGFLVAYPDGIDRHWNDGRAADRPSLISNVDDVAFVAALIDHLVATETIDQRRVYATGMSNGAIFSQRLGCELAGKLAAITPVAGSLPESLANTCQPARPVPVLIIMGEADPFVPWAGGRVKGPGYGPVLAVPDTISTWVRQNGCASGPAITQEPDRDPQDGTTVRRETYSGCQAGATVTIYAVVNGGHTWPGGVRYLPETTIGPTNRDIDASALIWDFFAAHPRP